MTRDMRLYIQDILESIEAIGEYVQSTTEEQFYRNRQVQDAVLRDVLIHEYFGVSLKRVWRVIKIDLVDLKSQILRIWEELKPGSR